jgi:crotonobetainyl-CoA:carnitine CoA-transferase CaiB-like acyl-CoA transferase
VKLLAGIRILELTRLLPGPLCTWHLQGLGAQIIKIEGPGEGDYAKAMCDLDTDGISFFYKHLNAGKTLHVRDLKTPADHAQFLEMVKAADAVIESFRPGVMARLHLSHAQLAAVNPRVSLISISGYGQTGPMAQAAGHDINYMAGAGMLHELIGAASEEQRFIPMPNLQFGDVLGGAVSAAMMTLAAILSAQRTGRGSHVDVSMTAQLQANNVMPLFETMARGQPGASGQSLLNGGVPCYGMYRTADDRFLAVGALELKFWQALCDALSRPDLRDIHWQRGEAVASKQHLHARRELQAVFATRSMHAWAQFFAQIDCCVTPVLRLDEVLAQQVKT